MKKVKKYIELKKKKKGFLPSCLLITFLSSEETR